MTRQTFYRNLRKIAHLYNWKTHYTIRGEGFAGGPYVCPITAVARAKGFDFTVDNYDKAANALGLCHKDRLIIAGTSDNNLDWNKQVKKALMRAIGRG